MNIKYDMMRESVNSNKYNEMEIRILHLEDLATDAELIQDKLKAQSSHFIFKTVEKRQHFLKELNTFKPDIILSDYTLPDWDGLEVIKKVKNKYAHIPIIIITGTLNEEKAVELMKAGAADYILKENLARLYPAVQNALEIKRIILERKQAEEKIHLANKRMQYMLFSTSAIIYSISPAIGYSFTFISENIYNMMHYKADDVFKEDRFWEKRIHADDKERIKKESKIIFEQYRVTHEYRFLRGDDTYIWLRDEKKMIMDNNQRPVEIIGHIINITDRILTEQELRKSEDLYRSVVSSMSEGIIITYSDRTMRTCNIRAEEMLGIKHQQIVHQNILKSDLEIIDEKGHTLKPDDLFSVKSFKTGKPILNKIIGIKKYGNELFSWLSVNAQPVFEGINKYPNYVVTSFNDITKRKKYRDELEKSEEKYRKFFENDLSGIYTTTVDGIILDCNTSFARLLGFNSSKDVMTKNVYSFYPDRTERDTMIQVVKKEGLFRNNEVELIKKDGQSVYCIENVIGIFNGQEALSQLTGYLIDITERNELEEKLIQSRKLEGIGQLAGGIAHDFNNILTVINGYCETILMQSNENSPYKKEILEIKAAGNRAASLTRQLLAFSRRQIIQPEVISLSNALNSIKKMLTRLIGENIDIQTHIMNNTYNVKMDPSLFDQVIINLSVNARDAMPDGGVLTIETKNIYLDQEYSKHHVSVNPGNYVLMSISDTGIGMDNQTKKRIFEPFFTTKEKGKGTGMGLATVYGIIKQTGGNIWVYSELGKGTTFKLYLPAIQEDIQEIEKTSVEIDDYSGKESILIVEDDSAVRELTCSFLEIYGYKIIEAKNVDHALEIVKSKRKKIHLLITDVIMPKMSGHQLADMISDLMPKIKILFVTGYADNSIVHHGVLEKGVNLLTKPFSPRDLAIKVREILSTK